MYRRSAFLKRNRSGGNSMFWRVLQWAGIAVLVVIVAVAALVADPGGDPSSQQGSPSSKPAESGMKFNNL